MVNTEVIVKELDRLYEFEINKYVAECDDLKRMGYKIYRNDAGKHKVVAPASQQLKDKVNPYFAGNDLASFMNGLFGSDIF